MPDPITEAAVPEASDDYNALYQDTVAMHRDVAILADTDGTEPAADRTTEDGTVVAKGVKQFAVDAAGARDASLLAQAAAEAAAAVLTPRARARLVERLAPPLPSGAIVDLFFLDAEADPVTRLANRAASEPISDNLLFGGADYMTDGNVWAAGGGGAATITAGIADRDGTDRAVRLQLPAGAILRTALLSNGGAFPANGSVGYCFGAWMRSRTGVAQTVRLGRWQQNSYTDVTVGTAWTLVFVAVLGDAGWYPAIKAPDGQALDIEVYQPRLVAGDTFGTEPHVDGHLYYRTPVAQVGIAAVQNGPAAYSELIQLDNSYPLAGGYTYIVALRQTESTAVSTNDTVGLVTLAGDNRQGASLFIGSNRLDVVHANNSTSPRHTVDLRDEDWTMASVTYDPVRACVSLYVDDVEIIRNSGAAVPTGVLRDIVLASLFAGGGGYALRGEIGRVVVYPRGLSPAEMQTAYDSVSASMRAGGVQMTTPSAAVVAECDSLTGYPVTYVNVAAPSLPGVRIVKSAIYGSRMEKQVSAEITSAMQRVPRIAPVVRDGRQVVATLLCGANDLFASAFGGDIYPDAASFYAAILQWRDRMRQIGMRGVGVSTLLPIIHDGQNARHDAVNALLDLGLAAGDFEVLIDYRPTAIGQPNAHLNTTYYDPDGVHLKPAGNAVAAPVWVAGVKKLLAL